MGKIKAPKTHEEQSPTGKVTKVKPSISKIKRGASTPQPPEKLKKVAKSFLSNGSAHEETSKLVKVKGEGKQKNFKSSPKVIAPSETKTPSPSPTAKKSKKKHKGKKSPEASSQLFSIRQNIVVGGKSQGSNKDQTQNLGNVNKTKRITPQNVKASQAIVEPKGKRNINEVEKDLPEKKKGKKFKKQKTDKKKPTNSDVKPKDIIESNSSGNKTVLKLNMGELDKPIKGLLELDNEESKNVSVPVKINLTFFRAIAPTKKFLRFSLANSLFKKDAKIGLLVRDSCPEPEKTIERFKEKLGSIANRVQEIIPLATVSKEYYKSSSQRELAQRFDLFLVDSAIAHRSNRKIGQGLKKAKKVPIPIRFDSNKSIEAQFQKCLRKTTAVASKDTSKLVFPIANSSMTVSQVKENIRLVWSQINDLLPGGIANLKSASVQKPPSPAIPFYASLKTYDQRVNTGSCDMIWQRPKSGDKNTSVHVYSTGNVIVEKSANLANNQKKKEMKNEKSAATVVKKENEANKSSEEGSPVTTKDKKQKPKGNKEIVLQQSVKDTEDVDSENDRDSDDESEDDEEGMDQYDFGGSDLSDLEFDEASDEEIDEASDEEIDEASDVGSDDEIDEASDDGNESDDESGDESDLDEMMMKSKFAAASKGSNKKGIAGKMVSGFKKK